MQLLTYNLLWAELQVDGEIISVEWESPLWIRAEGSPEILITQLDAMPMRIIGRVESIEQV